MDGVVVVVEDGVVVVPGVAVEGVVVVAGVVLVEAALQQHKTKEIRKE